MLVEQRFVHEQRDRALSGPRRARREERPLQGLGRQTSPEELDVRADQPPLEELMVAPKCRRYWNRRGSGDGLRDVAAPGVVADVMVAGNGANRDAKPDMA
jgi:hypothetical protein